MDVQYALIGDVGVITLDRPERFNAINSSLGDALIEALGRVGSEGRAAVLTGAGRAFCSGADIVMLLDGYDQGGPNLGLLLEEVFHPVVEALVSCQVPVVGAINGVAAGAGLGLALACDLRVMAENAFLTSAFTGIGLVPDSGTTWWLPHHVGVSRALELTLTNRRVGAEEAVAIGLAAEVAPDDEVVTRARDIAAELADLVPDSLVSTRRLIRGSAALDLEQALTAEREEQDRLGRTPEHREGVRAFVEKRVADFRNA